MRSYGRKRNFWVSSNDLCSSFGSLSRKLDNLMLLNSVWVKETGKMSRFWELDSVKGSTLFIKVSSSTAAHELSMQSQYLAKSLNKYFSRPWIKQIKRI